MLLKPSRVSTDRLTFCREEWLLVAEMSDLPGFGRVWDDACDEGLTLVSHRTGREVVYAVNHIERDDEGDLLYWDLRPVDHRDNSLPTLRVFND